MFTRLFFAALAIVAAPIHAHADESCADNFLSGSARYVIDAESGTPIVTLPYAATGYAGSGVSYTVDLGGGGATVNGYGKPVDPPVPPEPPEPPEPPVQPDFMDDLALSPNSAGATRLTFPGDGTGRLTGPTTDFIFTGVDPTGLFVDGDLIARAGSGIIDGQQTMAVVDANGVALRVGSGFNTTRTRGVNATFTNGAVLDTIVQIGVAPPPAGGFTADLMLGPNAIGATRLRFFDSGTARLTGPGTDFTFGGVDPSALAVDGPIIALSGRGLIDGASTEAVPLPGEPGSPVLTVGSGFNATGTQRVRARFSNGALLEATVLRN